MNHKPKNNNNDPLDAWVILEHLHSAQRQDLRDYLIHQLYYLSENDIDFFLPQLCTLLVVVDNDLSKQLECFILHNCMRSIDFAIKCFWNLHAIQFYSKDERQTNRCDDVRQSLEMIVVNGNLPRSLLLQIPKDIRQQIIKQETERPDRSPHHNSLLINPSSDDSENKEDDEEEEEEKKNDNDDDKNLSQNISPTPSPLPSPINHNKNDHQNGHIDNKKKSNFLPAPHKNINGHHNKNKNDKNDNNNTSSSSSDESTANSSSSSSSSSNSNSNSSSSVSSSSSPSPNNSNHQQQSKPLSNALPKPKKPNLRKETLLNGANEYLKKQRRCTYFNAELDFAHFLEGVSSALEQCEREDRPRLLEDNVRYANKCLPRGLYIPINHSATDKHKSLLRIVPNESKCLDSKQKVPFLLFYEVEEHDYSTSSPQICEELTESETALLSSSGLYVLIDEHRKRKQRELRQKEHETNKKLKKLPTPKRLKATKRKPSKGRLSFSKSKNKLLRRKNKNKHKEKDEKDRSSHSLSARFSNYKNKNKNSKPKSPRTALSLNSPSNTPTIENERSIISDYSVSKNYSDDDETRSYSNENTELSKSKSTTLSTLNPLKNKNLISLDKVPIPQPKPKDIAAEEAMKRHLQALEPFEPDNHKSPKIKTMYNGNNKQSLLSKPNEMNKSKSFSQLLSPGIKNKFRSRTPEPKHSNKPKNNNKKYKSDGNSTDESSDNSNNHKFQIVATNRNGNANGNGKHMNNNNSAQQQKPQQNLLNNNKSNSSPNFSNHLNNSPKSQPSASQSSISKPNVVIYRHPNYSQIQRNKIQYLRGKSMSWKNPYGEVWHERLNRFKNQSPFKNHSNWNVNSVIFKSGEDMRQEQMAMQFIRLFDQIFHDAKLPLQLRPYSVVVTSPASGFVETVPNAVSISRLKHSITNFISLRKFFEQYYGPVGSPGFSAAQKNFVESMAGYSLVCYFLQIKDRHNGNILMDAEGRVVHIDFDFLFSNSPGGNIGFESAPFKLTEEYIEVMGGEENSEMFDYFKILLIRGFLEARKHYRKFLLLSKIMLKGAPMPCFLAGQTVINSLKERFAIKLKNEKCVEHVYNLIEESSCNWRSVQYDKFQRITNNIL